MDVLRWLIAVVLVALPIVWWLWRESRDKEPSVLWPRVAPALGLKFSEAPPCLKGEWNGRPVEMVVESGRTVASARYQSRGPLRLEIGARAELEKAAGMVVPDRVEFREDGEFSQAMLVRSSPEELARMVVDPTLRRRLLGLPGVHLLATGGRVDVSLAEVRREAEFRELFDLASAAAHAAEQ